MLDTTIFNRVLDGQVPALAFAEYELFITHIQQDELERCSEPRRSRLLGIFHQLNATDLPTETAIWGDSKWGRAKWSSKDGLYLSLLRRLKEIDRKDRGLNQSRDARIAETTIKKRLVLLTSDANLAVVVKEHGGEVSDPSRPC